MLGVDFSLSSVGALAKAVYDKYQSVKALKPECRRARDVAEVVRALCAELDTQGTSGPIGSAMRMLRAGLVEAGEVLDLCGSQPMRAKAFSATYIAKLNTAVSHMLEGTQLLSGANVGLTLELQEQVGDAAAVMKRVQTKLEDVASGVADAVSVELRAALREDRAQLVALLRREKLAIDEADAERQLKLLREEQDKVRAEKTFNRELDEQLLRAVCALSLAQPAPPAPRVPPSPDASVPDAFVCPISLEVMADPVMVVQSGISYERAQIEEALRINPCRDPKTNQEWATPLTVAPNVALRKAIREWHEQRPAHSGAGATTTRSTATLPDVSDVSAASGIDARMLAQEPQRRPAAEQAVEPLRGGGSAMPAAAPSLLPPMAAEPETQSVGRQQPEAGTPAPVPQEPPAAAVARLLRKVGMRTLEEAVRATRLEWNSKGLDAEDAKVVAYVIAASGSLATLDLRANKIGPDGAKAIADAVAASGSLAELWLSGNTIGDEGAKALAAGVAASGSLAKLDLRCNEIGDEGAKALAAGVAASGSLATLWLAGNNIGDEGAKALAAAVVASGSLAHLYLHENNIGNEGAKALAAGVAASGSLALKTLYVGSTIRTNADLVAACQSKGVQIQ